MTVVSDVDGAELAAAKERVHEEMVRFRLALPRLVEDPELRGRWVVFRNGAVLAALNGFSDACGWGDENLGEFAHRARAGRAP
jgi:hypothetical protein